MIEVQPRSPEEEAMIRSGVGRRYLKRSLNDWAPESQPVIDLVQRPLFRNNLLDGQGAVFSGPSHFTDEMVHMVTRSILLRGVNCILIDLPDLNRAMVREEAPDATVDRIERAAVILIPSFTAEGYPENPLPRGTVFGLERVLTTFLDEGRALVLGASLPLSAWWSPGLVKHINRHSETITL